MIPPVQVTDSDADLDAGLAHHAAGRFADAEQRYRNVLARDPDHADALNMLGVLLADAGDLPQSISVLSRAVEIDPEFAEAFANLSRAQFAAGDHAGAKVSGEQAVLFDPELPEACLHLGCALFALHDDLAAADALRRAVALAPDSADGWRLLGHALARLKDYAGAVAAYRRSDCLVPEQPATLAGLGNALTGLTQLDEALACCRRAVALEPSDANAHVSLGMALHRAGDVPAAIEAFRNALRVAPERPDAWKLLGDCLSVQGRFDEAEACYRRQLALDADSSEALIALAGIGRIDDRETARDRLGRVLSDGDRPARERVEAGFALGALQDSEGDYGAAFTAYNAANHLARDVPEFAGDPFDPLLIRRQVNQIRTAFTHATFTATREWGNPSEAPVFVVGMPRSGTTLVEQILAGHSRVRTVGERKDIVDVVGRLESNGGVAPLTWDASNLRREAERHLARLREIAGPCDRIIDKLPDNLLFLGHIALLFPNARAIICRRDPRDISLSCFFQLFADGISWSLDPADCAARALEVERLVEHWRSVQPLRMLEVDYESLVGDLEGESRRLIEFLGLDWEDACLAFNQSERPVHTASFWQIRQPLFSSSVGRWRRYQRWIQPMLDVLVGEVSDEESEVSLPKLLSLAGVHEQAGRLAAAESAYRRVLRTHPDNAGALLGLGRIARRDGDGAQAVALLTRAAENSSTDDAEVLIELCHACRLAGDLRAAADAAAQVAVLNPDDATAYFLLGIVLFDLNEAADAREALCRAVELAPDMADAQVLLATACIRLKDLPTALGALQQAIRLKPDDPECVAKLGWVLRELEQFQDALPYLRRALELAPQDARIHLALIIALWRTHDIAAAEVACDEALRIAPDHAQFHIYRGHCDAARGRFGEAARSYHRALSLDSSQAEARVSLMTIRESENLLDPEQLERDLADLRRERSERMAAGYALGQLYDRAGDYDAAFDAAAAANRLLRETIQDTGRGLDESGFERQVDATITIFSRENLRLAAGLGDSSDLPVFVVGMPRSGTTLVEQIACSHPDVFGAGEIPDFLGIVQRLDGGLVCRAPATWDRAVVASEAESYLRKLRERGGEAKRVIDKMLGNFCYLGHISVLFPRARIVVCYRDLRDVGLSCYFQSFGFNLAWTTDLSEIAGRARQFERMIAHWREVLPLPMLEVRYEDLVANQERESRRLIDFLGLEWDPACLAFHETQRTVMTASLWQVRQPMYDSSIGRWRHYRKHLGPLLEGLKGYLPEYAGDQAE